MSQSHFVRLIIVILVVFLFVFIGHDKATPEIAHSQNGGDDGTACNTLVDEALATIGSACDEMGNNEACYGNILVAATLNEDSDSQFETSGDIVNLNDLQALFTQPANPDDGTWGLALMTTQADLPAYTGTAVTYVLFGDARPYIILPLCGTEITYTVPSNCLLGAYNYLSFQGPAGVEMPDFVIAALDSNELTLSVDGATISASSRENIFYEGRSAGYILESYDIGPLEAGSYTVEHTGGDISIENGGTCTILVTE